MVETITLGNEMGTALRMIDAHNEVPPDPPIPMIAWIDDVSKSLRTNLVALVEMYSIYSPRERVEQSMEEEA